MLKFIFDNILRGPLVLKFLLNKYTVLWILSLRLTIPPSTSGRRHLNDDLRELPSYVLPQILLIVVLSKLISISNNNNNCLKSNIQCIEIRVQWTVHLGSSHMHVQELFKRIV